jgi:hypothetical protein
MFVKYQGPDLEVTDVTVLCEVQLAAASRRSFCNVDTFLYAWDFQICTE